MTDNPMSDAELLDEILRDDISANECFALIAQFRAAVQREERKRCETALREVADAWVGGFSGLPTGDDVAEFISNTLIPALPTEPEYG